MKYEVNLDERRSNLIRRIRNWAVPLLAVAPSIPALAQNSGEAVYKAKCAMCHGAEGERIRSSLPR